MAPRSFFAVTKVTSSMGLTNGVAKAKGTGLVYNLIVSVNKTLCNTALLHMSSSCIYLYLLLANQFIFSFLPIYPFLNCVTSICPFRLLFSLSYILFLLCFLGVFLSLFLYSRLFSFDLLFVLLPTALYFTIIPVLSFYSLPFTSMCLLLFSSLLLCSLLCSYYLFQCLLSSFLPRVCVKFFFPFYCLTSNFLYSTLFTLG